jgi:outer membrane protein assembly factor BamA
MCARNSHIRIFELSVSVWLLLLCSCVFSACNTTKFVPQGEYLLNDVKIKVQDTKKVSSADLMKYVQQKQNTEILGFWKLQLDIYNTASEDSTKWTSRNARKIGEAPVIYSQRMTEASCVQLVQAMNNKGYFQAEVDTFVTRQERKIDVLYQITANRPYIIANYNVNFEHEDLAAVAENQRTSLVRDGMQYDADILNQERQRIVNAMRARGYFYFDQEFIQFKADSSRGNGAIDVEIGVHDYLTQIEDVDRIFRKYKIARVHFHVDYDPERIPMDEEMFASAKDGYVYTWVGKKLLRDNVIVRNCPIRPGDLYNVRVVERAYAKLNQLAPVQYVDISFEQISEGELDCHIVLSRGKLNSVTTEVEGTYSAGDWGVAAGIGYVNRNLFRGAEEASVDARASYEWRQNGGRAIEAKASAQMKFPSAVAVDLIYNFQNRPDEYARSIFGASLNYTYKQPRANLEHQFRFLDISYVYLPWISDAFRDQFLQSTNILKYSYENHFIVGLGYSGHYTSFRSRQPHRSYWSIYYNVETAGNLLRALATPLRLSTDQESGNFILFNTQFAQFAKGDISATYNQNITPNHRLVFHADLGVAVPYGNSQTIPFEKRYFAGGSNSVRGWAARTLGPGGYKGNGRLIDFNNQSGDIRLNLNLEYRARVWSIIELAAFFDAGNIWTVYDYEAQPYGVFRWNEFYKQIALAYGVGVRFDLSFFVFRVDMGVKLYDPGLIYNGSGKQWRTVGNGLNWKDDFAMHFAIGYPF